MIIGVPKEIKDHEYRVALLPSAAYQLVKRGHQVLVERNAGAGAGYPDADYEQAGATMISEHRAVFEKADLIVKVKEPLPPEYPLLRQGQILFTYLHLAASRSLTEAMLKSGVTGIAYETIEVNRRLPLLEPMSEIAGRMSVLVGGYFLAKHHGGSGVLLGGVPGVPPGSVVVLGAGTVGSNAVQIAVGLGARVLAVDRNPAALARLDAAYHGRVETLIGSADAIARAVSGADLVVGAVLVPGARAPVLVSRAMVEAMAPGSAIVDVAVDQGGCVATTRPTTHTAPTYVEAGVVHYAVPNMPALVPRTATLALTNATLPYLQELVVDGTVPALRADPALARGLTIWGDRVTCAPTAAALGLPAADPAPLLAARGPLALSA